MKHLSGQGKIRYCMTWTVITNLLGLKVVLMQLRGLPRGGDRNRP